MVIQKNLGKTLNFLVNSKAKALSLKLVWLYFAPLGNGLFEFRAKGKEGVARSIFVSTSGKKIVILHSVIKKSLKIPKKDLDLAKKRAKELK